MRQMPHRSSIGVSGLMLLALLLVLTAAAPLSAAPGPSCRVSAFSLTPTWVGSGFWNNSNLVVLDSGRRGLLPYSNDGWARRGVSLASKSREGLYPLGAARRSDGRTGDGKVIVYEEFNRFVTFSPTYTYESSFDASLVTDKGSFIDKIYTWAPTWSPQAKDIVALADLRKPGTNKRDQWSMGIVRFSLDQGNESSALELGNYPLDDASRKFHRLGYPYTSSLQDNAYVLLMGNGFQLWRSDKSGGFEELEGFRSSFPVNKVPALPTFVRPDDYSLLMSEVENSEMPTGLHSWEGNLYLVWRRPDREKGGTQWLLSRIRPRDGMIMATAIIPSRANHLLAVPGPEWAFIEKGPALGLQDQDVQNLRIVPASNVNQALAEAKKSPANLCP